MQKFSIKEWTKNHQLHLFVIASALLVIITYSLLSRFTGIDEFFAKIWRGCVPFIYGAIIAYILRPCCDIVYKLLQKNKFMKNHEVLTNAISVTVSLIIGTGVLILVGLAIIPELVDSVTSLFQTLPDTINKLVTQIEEFLANKPEYGATVQTVYEHIKETFNSSVLPKISEITSSIGAGALSVAGFITNLFIGIVAAVYILADRHRLKAQLLKCIRRIPKDNVAKIIEDELRFIDKTFSKYLTGTIIDALIVGVSMYTFCAIANIPSPLLIATICAITNIIPVIGPFLGAIPSGFIVLAYAPDKFLIFCIFVFILQQIDGHILVPKVLGEAVGISGLLALLAITLGGELYGAIGMVFGVPVVTVIIDIFEKLMTIKQQSSESEGGQ